MLDAGCRIINETNSFMDRQGIILATYLKNNFPANASSCGEENCECDAIKTEEKITQLRRVAIIVVLAFACALGLTILKINAAETVLQTEKARTIACGSQNDKQKRNKKNPFNDYQSNKNNNGNCPHPSASSVFGCCNDFKRKKNQVC
jgi:hypothetical protein